MPEIGEIEKRIKELKTEVTKRKGEGISKETDLRQLKKKLRRAQRKRRAAIAYGKRLQERKKKKEEPKTGEAAGG
jgi:hypothetical protein